MGCGIVIVGHRRVAHGIVPFDARKCGRRLTSNSAYSPYRQELGVCRLV